MEKTMLFLPILQRSVAEWFSTTKPTTVLLFMYPKGTLLGQTPPLSRPVLFHGPVGANNDVSVSPSRETDVTCEIRNLSWPVVQDIPTRNIPPVRLGFYTFPGLILTMDGVRPDNQNYPFRTLFA
jgi:hypothetical protein